MSIELDLETHQYRADGRRCGGVTEIITSLGIVDRSWYTEHACRRGTAVHRALESILTGRLDLASAPEEIRPYLEAAVRFLADAGVDIAGLVEVERIVYHPHLHYGGMVDLIGTVFGRRAIVDWKSGGSAGAGLQTAAYEMAYRAETGCAPLRRMAVLLRPDGTYRKEDFDDPTDYIRWSAAVELYNQYHAQRRDGR